MGMRVQDRDWIRDLIRTSGRHASATGEREELELSVDGVSVRAWITDEGCLAIDVDAIRWNEQVESALYAALDRHESFLAGLLLWEWGAVREECKTSTHPPLASTRPPAVVNAVGA